MSLSLSLSWGHLEFRFSTFQKNPKMSFAPLILFIVEMNLYPKSQDMQKNYAAFGAVIQNWHKEHLLELFERRQIALQRPSPVLAPVLW